MQVKSLFSRLCIIGSFMCLPLLGIAQDGPGDPGEDPDEGGTQIPFDGGLSLLVGAGVAYGLKKANDNRKKKQVSDQQKETL